MRDPATHAGTPQPDAPRVGRLAAAVVRMYPRAWRRRYGVELLDLLAARPPGPRELGDLLLGALSAYCCIDETCGRWTAMTSVLRAVAVRTFVAWVGFCLVVVGLVKATEDPVFTSAAQAHLGLGVGYDLIEAAAVIAGLAVLTGGLPLATRAIRDAWRRRDRVVLGLVAIVVLAVAVVVAYPLAVLRVHHFTGAGSHDAANVGLFTGWLVLGALGVSATLLAIRAAVARSELPVRLLRLAGWAATVAAASITAGVAGFVIYGLVLYTQEPGLFSSDNGLLSTPLPLTYLPTLAVGLLVAVTADQAAWRGVRSLRAGNGAG